MLPPRRRRRPPAKRRKPWENPSISSVGGSRAWTKMVKLVVKQEPVCRLRLPCCTVRSTTADHIIPKSFRPDLAMERRNLRGSCVPCNLARGNRPLEKVRAEMLASGKYRTKPAAALQFFRKRADDDD